MGSDRSQVGDGSLVKLAGRNKREAEKGLVEFRQQLLAFPGWGLAAIDPELSREHGPQS